MRVLRVETANNEGPYCGQVSTTLPYSTDGHPVPHQDAGIERCMEAREYCGFRSLRQLLDWFKGYFEGIGHDGFFVAVYQAPDDTVTVGAKQVLFERDKAKLVKRIPAHRFAFADAALAPESEPLFEFSYGEVAPF